MRRLLYALFVVLTSASASAQPTIIGPAQTAICNKIATLAAGPVVTTQIIAAVTGQSIFLCGWHVTNTGATGTFAIQTGTGSNCGTNTVTLIPAVNVTSTAPSADHIEYATAQIGPSLALCVTPSVATISFVIWYSQF